MCLNFLIQNKAGVLPGAVPPPPTLPVVVASVPQPTATVVAAGGVQPPAPAVAQQLQQLQQQPMQQQALQQQTVPSASVAASANVGLSPQLRRPVALMMQVWSSILN